MFYAEPDIPSNLIIHGKTRFIVNKGTIVKRLVVTYRKTDDKKIIYIVKYVGEDFNTVQLGFDEKSLSHLNTNESIDWDFDDEEFNEDEFINIPHNLSDNDIYGKRVKIKPNSKYWNPDNKHNSSDPPNVIGTAEKFHPPHPFKVVWDNGKENAYNRQDLIIQL